MRYKFSIIVNSFFISIYLEHLFAMSKLLCLNWRQTVSKMWLQNTWTNLFKKELWNLFYIHFCRQGNTTLALFKGIKVGTSGRNPWKVNMCLASFEEIWLQNNEVIDFWKHASWFAQQDFLNIRSKHQDVMFWIFTFSIFESSHLLVFECVITLRTALFWFTVTKVKRRWRPYCLL